MGSEKAKVEQYFLYDIPIAARIWNRLDLGETAAELQQRPRVMFYRLLAERLNRHIPQPEHVPAGLLNIYALLLKVLRHLIATYAAEQNPGVLVRALSGSGFPCRSPQLRALLEQFGELFPGPWLLDGDGAGPAGWLDGDDGRHGRQQSGVAELMLLALAGENPAIMSFRLLFDDAELAERSSYRDMVAALEQQLTMEKPVAPFGVTLPELLRAPIKASPHSLAGQIEFIRASWTALLPPELLDEMTYAFMVLTEEGQMFAPRVEPGGVHVLEFGKSADRTGSNYDYPEYERFSPDADWMANVVMLAKMVYVWLDQLSRAYRRPINRLDQIPDEELDRLARWGFSSLWLIGLWERSPASARIKQLSGNPEAIPSAYSLYDYVIANDLGGEGALQNLKERCRQRGIRLASDMVPNHTGIFSKWTVEHPDWFVQLDYPPYPAYSFNGADLSFSPEISLHIEDGYWERRDAAVVFKHYDHRNGRTRYIYHGNDGTSTPWNDTAQLNYLLPEVREAVIQTILHVARQFPVIRFDAAMTLAKKHYQRLWFPQPGGSGIPSRGEHGMTREDFDAAFPEEFWRQVVDRVAAEAPDTLLLAEAFWLMEGYFVRTLGMHRVYNSAFMNMLKLEENAKYRQTIKNVLEYDHRILQRFVNFMNNPDEKTAVEQFGKEGKYFGACVLLVTMPGLPMFGHGQIEGFHEKYGMEYRRAYWDEPVDEHLVTAHERLIFPLMRRRWIFSGSENFVCYDFFVGSRVDENVFAYSNRAGAARGVVLYNNRYGDTSGWINRSTAMLRDGALMQLNLGEALGLNPDPRCYYIFRDQISDRDYLRSGRELCEKGLFMELTAYEAHVFIDFREIFDDEYGTWGKLCHQLSGRPVADIDAEVKQIRHADLLGAFRLAVAGVVSLPDSAEVAEPPSREELLLGFYSLVNRHTSCNGDTARLTRKTSAALALLDTMPALLLAPEIDLGTPGDRLLAVAFLLLHNFGLLAPSGEVAVTSAAWFTELGLDRTIAELFDAAQAGEEVAPLLIDHKGVQALMTVMLRHPGFLTGAGETGKGELRKLFADPAAVSLLLCHKSGGVEWFRQERFELLFRWLVLTGWLAGEGDEKVVDKISAAMEKHLAQAVAAGFQVERLLALDKNSDAAGQKGADDSPRR